MHIQDAINAAQPGDTVSIGAGTYYEHLSIANDITLQGAGPGLTIVDGDYPVVAATVIIVNSGTVTISGVTVRNGYNTNFYNGPGGGGIQNYGTMTLENSAISGNVAYGPGGGILNANTITIISSTISGNQSRASYGGGILAGGTTTIISSTISSNLSIGVAGSLGGGSSITNYGALSIIQSSVSNNETVPAGLGVGIYNIQGSLDLEQSTISGNSDQGLVAEAPLTLTASTVSNNGGTGIFNISAHPLWITNSTVSNNGDGGLINDDSTSTVTNSTISGNRAPSLNAGGITNLQGLVQLADSLVAGNSSSTFGSDCNGTLTSLGNNIVGNDTSCSGVANGINGDQVGTASSPINALLGPLQDNGGPTWTMALLQGSPAIDAVPASNCTVTPDQRGQPRPDEAFDNGYCDIGAYEYQDTATITPTDTPTSIATMTPTDMPTATSTPAPTDTPTPTASPTSTPTDLPATQTAVALATQTAAGLQTQTAVANATQSAIAGPTGTAAAQTWEANATQTAAAQQTITAATVTAASNTAQAAYEATIAAGQTQTAVVQQTMASTSATAASQTTVAAGQTQTAVAHQTATAASQTQTAIVQTTVAAYPTQTALAQQTQTALAQQTQTASAAATQTALANLPTNTPTSTPTSTSTPIAAIVVTPAQVSPQQIITVTGTNFGTTEGIKVYWNVTSAPPLTATTTSAGAFTAVLRAPQAAFGAHGVIAVGQRSQRLATASVSIQPRLTLSPPSGALGATITSLGYGFGGIETVTLHWRSPTGPILATTTSTSVGSFGTVTFTVPASTPGSYRVYAIGSTTGAQTFALFTVT